jgi:hypothetical protein
VRSIAPKLLCAAIPFAAAAAAAAASAAVDSKLATPVALAVAAQHRRRTVRLRNAMR